MKKLALLLLALTGCRVINVEKHDPIVFQPQGSTNLIVVAEGGWEAHYRSYGMFTTFGKLDISVTSNGVACVSLSDLNSDVSTNAVYILNVTGENASDIISKVTEGLMK